MTEKARVWDVTEFFVAKDGDEGLVINTQDELWEAKEEESALVHCPGCSMSLTLNRSISRLGRVVELATAKYSFPSRLTATWLNRCCLTVTVLLTEPQSAGIFGPVCG